MKVHLITAPLPTGNREERTEIIEKTNQIARNLIAGNDDKGTLFSRVTHINNRRWWPEKWMMKSFAPESLYYYQILIKGLDERSLMIYEDIDIIDSEEWISRKQLNKYFERLC